MERSACDSTHKNNNVQNKENYRPVSSLSELGKLLEGVMETQLRRIAENFSILPPSQHGFRQNRSTVTALVEAVQWWLKANSHKKWMGILLFDLSAGFDTIDCSIICKKLEYYGMGKKLVSWIQFVLTNSLQHIIVGENKSCTLSLNSGTSQGSKISPILYLLLVADVDIWIRETNIGSTGFADDTTLYCQANSSEECVKHLQAIAEKMIRYFSSNNLIVNAEKTGFLMIRPSENAERNTKLVLRIADTVIE